jgi:hypothetical protein
MGRLVMRWRGKSSRWALARVLVCLGALLLVIANWLPWASVTVTFPNASGTSFTQPVLGTAFPGLLSLRMLSRLSTAFPFSDRWPPIVWDALLLGGILLALALWQRASARLALLTKRIVRGWVLTITLLELLAVWLFLNYTSWTEAGTEAGYVGGRLQTFPLVRGAPEAGLWLALASLALLWLGAYLMVGEPRIQERTAEIPAFGWRRSRAQLAGFGALLAGIVLWGLGYLALPWATVNCAAPHLSLTHYVDGICAALDSGDTLMAFAGPHVPSLESGYGADALLIIYVLLSGSALLLLAGAARHAYTRSFCGWVLAWLLAATGMALLSYRGVAAVVAQPPILSSTAVGAWHGDLGLILTLAGLLCAWASLIPLEAAGLAQAAKARRGLDASSRATAAV